MNEDILRADLDQIIEQVAHLAIPVVIENGEPITLDDIRKWDIFAEARARGEEITGFDQAFHDACDCRASRVSFELKNVTAMAVFARKDQRVLLLENRSQGGLADIIWADDTAYGPWKTDMALSWKKERAIDARHLTSSEIECLVALVNSFVSRHPGWSTRFAYHVRVTQEQFRSIVRRQTAVDWSRPTQSLFAPEEDRYIDPPYRLYHFNPPWQETATETIADEFRRYAPADLLVAGAHILRIFDRLGLRRIDIAAVCAAQKKAMQDAAVVVHSPRWAITVDSNGREEGYQGGWPLIIYGDSESALNTYSVAGQHLRDFQQGSDPETVRLAGIALYEMFPRLLRENMLNNNTIFGLETIDGQ